MNYAVAKPSDMPTWESQPTRSLLSANVNTAPTGVVLLVIISCHVSDRIDGNYIFTT